MSTTHHEGNGFEDELRESLRRAPWIALSAAAHAAAIVVLMQFEYHVPIEEAPQVIHCERPIESVELLVPEPPPPEPPEPQLVDVREEPIDDPTVATVESPFVSDALVPSELLTPVAAAFEGRSINDVIGTGGGAGGPHDGGGGPRIGRGGPRAVETTIKSGLQWLRRHQDPSGAWDSDGFGSRCRDNLCDGKGAALNDVGCTGLALLAFLGMGATPERGHDREVVRNGVRWLVAAQDRDDGCLGAKGGQHFLYGHAIGTLALVEAWHSSRMPALKGPAQQALDFISRSRNPYAAWRYAVPPDGDNDVSVTGWMLFALYAGREAGLTVDDGALRDGLAYVRSMTDPATGRTGYHEKGSFSAREADAMERWPAEQSEAMTACALLLDSFDGVDPASAAQKSRVDLLLARRPAWDEARGSIDFYYWYYGTYAMWQVGGDAWKRWEHGLGDTLLAHQRQDGDETGSWDPQVDPWGRQGGRIYSTAMNVLCLEVFYRYAKLFGTR
ncbi:MAG: terpene cyclase/mutase family protein [Planctomycetes bacterium]|nr:terpene cyclase/mutase family protein [Planctomycetota bacterium]